MKNKVVSGLILIVVVVFALLLIQPPESSAATLRVGFILPLTGEAATYGEDAKNAADLAIEDVQKNLGLTIAPVFEDSQIDPALAANAATKLLNVDKVDAIITFSSGETLAVCPITESKKEILLTSGSAPKISDCGDYTFRNYPSDIYQGKVLADKATEAGYKNIFLVYMNNDYGGGLKSEFLKNYKGGVVSEAHSSNEKDFRTLVAKIKANKSDAVILISQMAEASVFMTQMNSLSVRIPILASEALKDDEFISKIPARSAEFLSVVSVAQYEGAEAYKFQVGYKGKYGKAPGAFADYVYDNVVVLARAAKGCESNDTFTSCVLKKLENIQMTGVTGAVAFDSRGDLLEKPYDVFVVRGGKFEVK